jgi:hypothetical protein
MAKIGKPKGTKGAPVVEASQTLHTAPSGDYVGLNFKVSREFAREFKRLALENDMKLNEFLQFLVEQHRKP